MTRKVSIAVDRNGLKNFFRDSLERAKALDRGELLPEEVRITFEDPSEMMRMLTTERVRLLDSLKHEGEAQITDLAVRLGRNKRAVSRDVSVLREHGLLITKYVTNSGHGRNLVVSSAARVLELRAAI
ncbi:MAG TPA: hypothetical protein VFE38_06395 [Edaphobacter sp.]|nr:hypothetical protein [Edaphobacter sp.]